MAYQGPPSDWRSRQGRGLDAIINSMSEDLNLGQIAYEAYADTVAWTAYDGKRIAAWEDQDPDRCAGWTAAGERVAEAARLKTAACLIGSIPMERRTEAMTTVARAVELPPVLVHYGSSEQVSDPSEAVCCRSRSDRTEEEPCP